MCPETILVRQRKCAGDLKLFLAYMSEGLFSDDTAQMDFRIVIIVLYNYDISRLTNGTDSLPMQLYCRI